MEAIKFTHDERTAEAPAGPLVYSKNWDDEVVSRRGAQWVRRLEELHSAGPADDGSQRLKELAGRSIQDAGSTTTDRILDHIRSLPHDEEEDASAEEFR